MRGIDSVSRLLALVLAVSGLGFAAFAVPANAADETTWLCKPGDPSSLCAGTIDGTSIPPTGQTAKPLGYTRPADAPVDCFYLYPTQSSQATPNSDLAKDAQIRRVAVQQARMFSSICDVYAPMYRQVTFSGNQSSYNPDVETAYQSALSGFKDYLENYNKGRGFVLIGHSQGSAHIGRLIDEEIDNNPGLRDHLVGAIAPGANINVPVGKLVGGMYSNVPACSQKGEIGCLTAFSTYKGYPGDTAQYSRVNAGYWIYKLPRPDSTQEVVCVDPGRLDGGDGTLDPLINFDYLFDVPAGPETASPWKSQPEFYGGECKRQNGAHWLNISTLDRPGETRTDLGSLVASGSNYHVPEVNLAEANLLRITDAQTDTYVTVEAERAKIADAIVRRRGVVARIKTTKRKFTASRTTNRKLGRQLRKAKKQCRIAKRTRMSVKARCRKPRTLNRKITVAKRRTVSLGSQLKRLNTQLRKIDSIIP